MRKDRFYTSGGTRVLRFVGAAVGDIAQLKASGKTLTVSISPGLPKNASEFINCFTLRRCLFSFAGFVKAKVRFFHSKLISR